MSTQLRAGSVDGGLQLNTVDLVTFTSSSITLQQPTTLTGHNTIEGVTSTGATGTGNMVFATGPTTTGAFTTLGAGTTVVAPLTFTTGTNLTSPVAGSVEYDGNVFYRTNDTTTGRGFDDSWNIIRLAANGAAISTIADVFQGTGSAGDGIPTVLNAIYEIEWHCYGTVATGGTATWTIVNTQAPTNQVADWIATPIAGIGTAGAVTAAAIITNTSTSAALPVTGSLSVASHYHKIHAIIEAGTAGNVRLRLTMSAGTWTPLRGSFIKIRRLPTGVTANTIQQVTGTFVN